MWNAQIHDALNVYSNNLFDGYNNISNSFVLCLYCVYLSACAYIYVCIGICICTYIFICSQIAQILHCLLIVWPLFVFFIFTISLTWTTFCRHTAVRTIIVSISAFILNMPNVHVKKVFHCKIVYSIVKI